MFIVRILAFTLFFLHSLTFQLNDPKVHQDHLTFELKEPRDDDSVNFELNDLKVPDKLTFELKDPRDDQDQLTFEPKEHDTDDSSNFNLNDLKTDQDPATFDLKGHDTTTFDLNDPKTNLDSYIRVSGSQDASVTSINYINGTILLKPESGPLRKVFLLEGFNIGRKVAQSFGYLSLSREVLVYRDYHTGEIMEVFVNDLSNKANEVFDIHNNPVNLNLTYGPITPYVVFNNDRMGFNSDILLQYPNVLDPKSYPQFSSGPIYEADELFQFYARYSTLAGTDIKDLNYTGAWVRRSQFLPWLELGDYPGCMYYVATAWKSLNGLADIPADILSLVKKKYPEFLAAPEKFEVPNQTSWSNFKAVVDERRKRGEKDIVIPEVTLQPHLVQKKNNLDPRIYESLAQLGTFQASFSGSVYSEITGNYSVNLFNVRGVMRGKVSLTPGGPSITASSQGTYRDPRSGEELKSWLNPLTGQINDVPMISGSFSKVLLPGDDSVWSFPVPNLEETSVVGFDSFSSTDTVTGRESWSVNLLNVFFTEDGLRSKKPYFYGTWAQFSSWMDWMNMSTVDGNMVWRMNVELEQQ